MRRRESTNGEKIGSLQNLLADKEKLVQQILAEKEQLRQEMDEKLEAEIRGREKAKERTEKAERKYEEAKSRDSANVELLEQEKEKLESLKQLNLEMEEQITKHKVAQKKAEDATQEMKKELIEKESHLLAKEETMREEIQDLERRLAVQRTKETVNNFLWG